MPIPVVAPMDFNLFELLNTVSQNLAAAPAHKAGRFYYDTVLGKFGISTGAAWLYVGANSSDAFLLARGNHTGTQVSTTISDFNAAVNALIAATVGAAPAALDTLVELATALGNDANFAATMTAALAAKASIASLAPVATAGTYASLTGKPSYTATIGDGVATAIVVTHNLGTRAVIVDLSLAASPYTSVIAQIDKTTINTITATFAVAPAGSQYVVTVQA